MRKTLFLALLVGALLAFFSLSIATADYLLNNENIRVAFRSNILLLILVAGVSVGLGLMIALLVDHISKWELVAQSILLLPMIISVVGISLIWGLVYFLREIMAGSIRG